MLRENFIQIILDQFCHHLFLLLFEVALCQHDPIRCISDHNVNFVFVVDFHFVFRQNYRSVLKVLCIIVQRILKLYIEHS